MAAILVASTLLFPFSAAQSADADTATVGPGIHKPASINIGTDVNTSQNDPGVATFVGRDMYVGGKPADPSCLRSDSVAGSYAVEAEGLTIVQGKLALNPYKESWPYEDASGTRSGAGFRFGTVGFGAQFRPSGGSVVLAVAGLSNATSIKEIQVGTKDPASAAVGAWNKGAWVGQQKPSHSANASGDDYTAAIAGNRTNWMNNDKRQSVVKMQGNWDDEGLFQGNGTGASIMKINGKDYTNYLESEVKAKISTPLAGLKPTGSYTVGVAEPTKQNSKYMITKYNKTEQYGLTFGDSTKTFERKTNYTDVNGNNVSGEVTLVNNEKLITFTSDTNSPLQVFNLKASDLTNSIGDKTYRGVDFSFMNIPEDASVVVNIIDDKDKSATPVEFNTGWRFWWNGKEISRGYEEGSDVKSQYSTAAQSILWNFATASQVTIRGGMALEGNEKLNPGADGKWTDDDPAAAMLGSIVVPNGSFEDHVTTNGRVYVGGDFQMYNPTVAWSSFSEGKSASVIDMDQERHNFPWSGSYTPDGSAIAWSKVDAADRTTPLAGSEWAIYASEDDAKTNHNSIVSIVDNGMNDFDPTVGTIQFNYLNQKANIGNPDDKDYFTYYIRETKAPEGYELSNMIYTSKMFHTGDELNLVGNVDANGNEISSPQSAIANTKITGTVSWTKVDDKTYDLLPGSEWALTKVEDTNGVKIANAVSLTVIDNDKNEKAVSDKWADSDSDDGKFTLEGLLPGTYSLVETQAPFGYEKNPMEYEFKVSSTNGSITWTEGKKPTFDNDGNAYISDSLTTTSVTIPVTKSVRNTDWPKDGGNYVPFDFRIEATGDYATSVPFHKPADLSIAPAAGETDATKLNNITAAFGTMTFNKSCLSDIAGTAGDYAKTYTYTVKEVAPATGAIDKLRYSKAEYQVAVTVEAKLNDAGKYSGLTTSTTVTQVKDDMGNTVNKVIGTANAPDAIPASTFTNVKVLTDLPLTGAGWTENSMLLVGAGLMLLGGIAAGAYWFATKRRQDGPSDGAGR